MTQSLTSALLALAAGAACMPVQAQTYAGLPAFFAGPITQLGTFFNSTLTVSTASGITTSGFVDIAVAPGSGSGNLLQFIVDRPFHVNGSTSFTTSIDLDGWSTPPPGLAGQTGGTARTLVVDTTPLHNAVAGTQVSLPLSLVAGAATWPLSNPPAVSAPFTLPANNYILRQVFDLDGIYVAGPGGIWQVDFPLISSLNPVPEPSTYALLALGLTGLGIARRRLLGSPAS